MSVAEITSLFKLGKATAKSHMRNLIEIAAADGGIGSEEQRLLDYAAFRNNISKSQLQDIQRDASKIRFEAPRSSEEKFFQLYDLVHMMSVDENVHPEELRLCEIFAIKLGFRKEVVREMIDLIQENIKKWISPKDTMSAVLAKLKVYE
jgi:uncharacterized tellurite resistance protein B-like protein